ncbi:MAG: tetratricopeptide repeat protein, partial [Acidobacteriota bacterium]
GALSTELWRNRGPSVMASEEATVDVLSPEVYAEILSIRGQLFSTRSPGSFRDLDARLRQLELIAPGVLEVLQLRVRVLRLLYDATRDTDPLDRALGVVARAKILAPDAIEPFLLELEVTAALSQRGRVGELLTALERRFPDRLAHGDLLRAWATRVEGQPELALAALRRLAASRPEPFTLFELAHVEVELGEYGAARKRLEALLVVAPGMTQAQALLAQAEMLGGDLDRAIEIYRRLTDNQPGAGNLSNLGLALVLAGRLDEAKENFLRAEELAPSHPTVILNAADGLRYVGEGAAARSRYRSLLDLTGRPESAEDWNTWTVRAQALVHLGEPTEARKALRRARSLSNRPEVLLEAAVVLAGLGEDEAARSLLETAITERGLAPIWRRLPAFEAFGVRASP